MLGGFRRDQCCEPAPKEINEVIRQVPKKRPPTIGGDVAHFAAKDENEEFWRRARKSIQKSMSDPEVRRELEEEQRIYDGALLDGLEPQIL
jgi:hypothetical protein